MDADYTCSGCTKGTQNIRVTLRTAQRGENKPCSLFLVVVRHYRPEPCYHGQEMGIMTIHCRVGLPITDINLAHPTHQELECMYVHQFTHSTSGRSAYCSVYVHKVHTHHADIVCM